MKEKFVIRTEGIPASLAARLESEISAGDHTVVALRRIPSQECCIAQEAFCEDGFELLRFVCYFYIFLCKEVL